MAYVPAPTDMEFTPDGKYLFVTSKFGKIWRLPVSEMDDKNVDAEEVEVEEVFEIPHPMCTNGARGLGGIAIHPDYPAKPYLYVFHNHDKYRDLFLQHGSGRGTRQSHEPVHPQLGFEEHRRRFRAGHV